MKYKATLLALLATVLVGCATKHGRFDHRAKAQRVDRQHHRSDIGETVHVQERMRRIRIAVQEGKMTREEAAEKMKEFRGSVSRKDKPHFKKGKKDGTKIRSSKNRQQ